MTVSINSNEQVRKMLEDLLPEDVDKVSGEENVASSQALAYSPKCAAKEGKDGKDGKEGKDGKDGGKDGKDGGKDGKDGKDNAKDGSDTPSIAARPYRLFGGSPEAFWKYVT